MGYDNNVCSTSERKCKACFGMWKCSALKQTNNDNIPPCKKLAKINMLVHQQIGLQSEIPTWLCDRACDCEHYSSDRCFVHSHDSAFLVTWNYLVITMWGRVMCASWVKLVAWADRPVRGDMNSRSKMFPSPQLLPAERCKVWWASTGSDHLVAWRPLTLRKRSKKYSPS